MWIQREGGSNVPVSACVLCVRVDAGLAHHSVDDAQRRIADTKRNQHAHNRLGAIEGGWHRLARSVVLRTFGLSVLSNLAWYHPNSSVLLNKEPSGFRMICSAHCFSCTLRIEGATMPRSERQGSVFDVRPTIDWSFDSDSIRTEAPGAFTAPPRQDVSPRCSRTSAPGRA
jgi:hypothetical protein